MTLSAAHLFKNGWPEVCASRGREEKMTLEDEASIRQGERDRPIERALAASPVPTTQCVTHTLSALSKPIVRTVRATSGTPLNKQTKDVTDSKPEVICEQDNKRGVAQDKTTTPGM